MPLIQVKPIEEVFTPAHKKDIIAKLTGTRVAIEGENMRPGTRVVIEEVRSEVGALAAGQNGRRPS